MHDSHTEQSDHTRITSSAKDLGIIGAHGSNYAYIDQLADGTYAVIHETFSSRSAYKTITPIWIDSYGPIIDCTYIRSIEDIDTISIGSYCRGNVPASSEAIEDAVSERHTAKFNNDYAWLSDADTRDCTHKAGLEHGDYKVVRCGSGGNPDTTENVVTYIFSNNLFLHSEMPGLEFSGSSEGGQSLVFWKLFKDSPHEIINWRHPESR